MEYSFRQKPDFIAANLKELEKVDAELVELEAQMKKHLKALGIGK